MLVIIDMKTKKLNFRKLTTQGLSDQKPAFAPALSNRTSVATARASDAV
jgi:hypothetical protein